MWRLGEGYNAGATYADGLKGMTTEVFVMYHEDNDKAFADPEWAEATAKSIIDQGVDVVFSCGSLTGNAAIVAAARSHVYAIGVNTDQYFTLPEAAPRMLTSALQLIPLGILDLIKLAQNDRFPSGNYFGNVGYAPFHDLENEVPADIKQTMEEIQTGLSDGSIKTKVPSAKP